MPDRSGNESQGERRAVGIYDRPAKADRARNAKRWAIVVVVLAIALSIAFYWMRS